MVNFLKGLDSIEYYDFGCYDLDFEELEYWIGMVPCFSYTLSSDLWSLFFPSTLYILSLMSPFLLSGSIFLAVTVFCITRFTKSEIYILKVCADSLCAEFELVDGLPWSTHYLKYLQMLHLQIITLHLWWHDNLNVEYSPLMNHTLLNFLFWPCLAQFCMLWYLCY